MANVADELARLAELKEKGVLSPEEFDAQKARVLAGEQATTPGKPKPSLAKAGIGCVGLIVLLLIIGAIFGSAETSTTSSEPTKDATPPVEVTARELARAYARNEAAAQQTYGDRPIKITGVVASVELDFADDPIVQLRTDNEFLNAGAQLDDASKGKAAGLAKGQVVTLTCESVGEVIGSPQLRECALP